MHKVTAFFIVFFALIDLNISASSVYSINSQSDWNSGIANNVEGNSVSGSTKLLSESSIQTDEFSSATLSPFWTSIGGVSVVNLSQTGKIGLNAFAPASPGTIRGIGTNFYPAPGNAIFETGITLIYANTLGGIFISDGSNFVSVFCTGTLWYSERNGVSSVTSSLPFAGNGHAKIEKVGNVISTYCRSGATDPWLLITSYNVTFGPIRAGLGCISNGFSNDYSYYDYFRVSPYSAVGTWASPSFNLGGAPSTQGIVSWGQDVAGGTSVQIQTSTSPDQTNWSNWSAPYANNFGSNITSPSNQFIRVLATLYSDSTKQFSPVLNNISIVYPDANPLAPVVSSPSHPYGAWTSSQSFQLQWSMPAGNTAPESEYTYWLYLNSASAAVDTNNYFLPSSTVGQVHSQTINLTNEGSYQLNLTVTADAFSGGRTNTAAPYFFKHDRSAPGQAVITSPTHPELLFTNNRNPVFQLSATDGLSGVSGYAAVLDKVNVGDPGTSITHFGATADARFQVIDNGTYYLHARAIDAAGNTGPISHYGIRVDFSGALVSEAYVKALPNPVRTDTAKLEYELAAPATEVLLEFTSGNGDVVRSAEGGKTVGKNIQVWNVSDLPNGTYFFRVKAKSAEDGKTYLVNKKIALLR